jgi:hypothetical protein
MGPAQSAPDHDLAARAGKEVGDISGEWRMPALMTTGQRAVRPDCRGVIDHCEVKEQSEPFLVQVPVPAIGVDECGRGSAPNTSAGVAETTGM